MNNHKLRPRMAGGLLTALAIAFTSACTDLPTEAQIEAAGGEDAYWRDAYERQCLRNTQIPPGSPELVKCVEDLMDLREEQQRQ